MMIYLDNAATTKILPQVREKMVEMAEVFGNPSSLHGIGMAARREVEAARGIIAGCFGDGEVYFTSGGTEANAIALNVRGRVLVSRMEHPSVLENLRKNREIEIGYIDVGTDGKIDLRNFDGMLGDDVVMVSCMQVGNETGVVQPIAEMREIMRKSGSAAILHVDAVQGFGKISGRIEADMVTVSAHKIGGLKGTGALWVRKGVKVESLSHGGGQEKGIRAGTENVLGIACFGVATEERIREIERNYEHVRGLNRCVREGLQVEHEILSADDGSPYILNISFGGVMGQTVMNSMEMRGIYIGIGAACAANKASQLSEGLQAMGIGAEAIRGSVRLSFAAENTMEEVEAAVVALNEVVEGLRRIRR